MRLRGENPEVDVGSPEVITRRQEIEIAFAALGRKPRVLHVPRPLLGAAAGLIGIRDRRRAERLRFLRDLSSDDVPAPTHGERRYRDYREHV